MLQEIQELYAYNRWANDRVLAACAPLPAEALGRDMGSSFPTVLATLAHILGAEWLWLERWSGRSPDSFPAELDRLPFPALRERWVVVERAQSRFITALTEERVRAELAYRDMAGTPFTAPLWQLLRHLVNHSTYHRGQVVTLLRQLGAPAPATDLVRYYREQAPAVRPAPTTAGPAAPPA